MAFASRQIEMVGDWAIKWHIEATNSVSKDSGEAKRSSNKGIWAFRKESDNANAITTTQFPECKAK